MFDLLVRLSVFTHLNEPEQFEWLDELKRIASKGAVLLMTIHGDAAAWMTISQRILLWIVSGLSEPRSCLKKDSPKSPPAQ